MAWVKIDDHFDEHPKLAMIGPLGWGFWLAGLAYCNRNLTDGFIPWSKARTLASFEVAEDDGQLWDLSRTSGMAGNDIDAEWVIGLLVEAGLWDEVENGRGRIDGYQVHDYEDYQPTKEDTESIRVARSEAGRRGGLAKAKQNASKPLANSKQTASKRSSKNEAKVCPVPVPVPVPESQEPEPKKKSKTPTAAKLPRSDQPHGIAVKFLEVIGTNVDDVKPKFMSTQRGAAKNMLADGYSSAEIIGCAKYMNSENWRTSPFDLTDVHKQVGKWVAKGKPEHGEKHTNGGTKAARTRAALAELNADDARNDQERAEHADRVSRSALQPRAGPQKHPGMAAGVLDVPDGRDGGTD